MTLGQFRPSGPPSGSATTPATNAPMPAPAAGDGVIPFKHVEPLKGAADFLRTALQAAQTRIDDLEKQRAALGEQIAEYQRGQKGIRAALRALEGRIGAPAATPKPRPASSPGIGKPRMDEVLSLLAIHGTLTGEIVAGALGISRGTANGYLSVLCVKGDLRRMGMGRYAAVTKESTP